jgi:hypothetical protein
MGIEAARFVPQDELKDWRARVAKRGHTREVYTLQSRAPSGRALDGGDGAGMAVPAVTPMGPRATADERTSQLMKSMMATPESRAQLIRTMRHLHPKESAHLSDGQILELARKVYRQKQIESTNRVFANIGRGGELKIKTAGY